MDNGLLPPKGEIKTLDPNVLILIVMDNGLLRSVAVLTLKDDKVLILIVMDNGLLRHGEVYLGFNVAS